MLIYLRMIIIITDENGGVIRFNTSVNNQKFTNTLNNLGYDYVFVYNNDDASYAYQYLREDDVFVYNGHGTPGGIIFHDTGDVLTGSIVVHEGVTNKPNEHLITRYAENELASLRCVL